MGYLIVNDPHLIVEVRNGRGGASSCDLPSGTRRDLSIGVHMPFHFYRETDITVRMANGAIQQGSANFSSFLTLIPDQGLPALSGGWPPRPIDTALSEYWPT